MQDRGASLIGRTLKLTFAINASCLAKERCIPETDNSDKYIHSWRKVFKGTKDLFKLRPGRKKTIFGGFDYSGSKVKVPSV
jgi:hypothetical protein